MSHLATSWDKLTPTCRRPATDVAPYASPLRQATPSGPLLLKLLLRLLEVGAVLVYELVVARLRISVVQEHRLEEVELVGEDGRHHEEHEEDGDTRQNGYLGHYEGAKAQKRRPPIDEQHGLSLIKSLVDKTMMNVPTVRLPYAHMGATSPDDGREGVDDGYRCHDQGDDDGGEARHARDRE